MNKTKTADKKLIKNNSVRKIKFTEIWQKVQTARP